MGTLCCVRQGPEPGARGQGLGVSASSEDNHLSRESRRQDGQGGLDPRSQSPPFLALSKAMTDSQAKVLESCWNARAGCRQCGSGVLGLPKQLTGSRGWGWGKRKVGRREPPGSARPNSCFLGRGWDSSQGSCPQIEAARSAAGCRMSLSGQAKGSRRSPLDVCLRSQWELFGCLWRWEFKEVRTQ